MNFNPQIIAGLITDDPDIYFEDTAEKLLDQLIPYIEKIAHLKSQVPPDCHQ